VTHLHVCGNTGPKTADSFTHAQFLTVNITWGNLWG